jgi:NDP-sugar pyrophosphorylase family protein
LIPIYILAGGMGTRLGELTRTVPKSLIPINGTPFLKYKLWQVASWGGQKVVLCVGHMALEVCRYVRELKDIGLSIEFSSDGEQNLGTGGAIAKAARLLNSDTRYICVTYGDSLVFPELTKHPASTKLDSDNWDAVVTVIDSSYVPGHRSNVSKRVNGFSFSSEAPANSNIFSHIEYGLLYLRTAALLSYAESRPAFELKDYLEASESGGKLSWLEETTPFIEIGTPESLKQAEARIAKLNLL